MAVAAEKITPRVCHTESSIKSEINSVIENYRAFWHGHGYQPWRKLWFEDEKKPVFDISQNNDGSPITRNGKIYSLGWNECVSDECYASITDPIPQEFNGQKEFPSLINSPFFSFHLFGTIRKLIKNNFPAQWEKLKKAVEKQPFPILDPLCHPILPLLPDPIQKILIESGIRAYEKDYGIQLKNNQGKFLKPAGFWLPEMAVSQNTLDILAKHDISFVFLYRDQIYAAERAPIYEIETTTSPIYVLVADRNISNKISSNKIQDVNRFYSEEWQKIENHSLPILAANDLETQKHHLSQMIFSFNYLLREKMGGDENPRNLFHRDATMIRKGQIKENSSWSCEHGLRRWAGKLADEESIICRCGVNQPANDDRVNERYEHFKFLQKYLANLLNQLNQTGVWEQSFADFLFDQYENMALGEKVSLKGVQEKYKLLFKRLLVNITGLQSCGWFFSDGDSTFEKQIPIGCINTLNINEL